MIGTVSADAGAEVDTEATVSGGNDAPGNAEIAQSSCAERGSRFSPDAVTGGATTGGAASAAGKTGADAAMEGGAEGGCGSRSAVVVRCTAARSDGDNGGSVVVANAGAAGAE